MTDYHLAHTSWDGNPQLKHTVRFERFSDRKLEIVNELNYGIRRRIYQKRNCLEKELEIAW
ncbi:hypothetical protein SS50377_20650 [Spironucleus salmonicida]|uniref:Uncharacterized protein n=1 Tax=Spironucleus salmonicida TaxID=348837 RepID=V6M0D2_9EUKA|nr:hypothetical protein SS50377_20650 [Spironucleus salmonicida]|eukprot:EST49501.1 Hypothetical protein SS50377_10099 [Spironucleus salmonicida]